jgi:nucleotide-binding universal stress UspA family protein
MNPVTKETSRDGGNMETIVVGVDGSKCSEAALGVAAEEASLREARLLIISAWEVPTSATMVLTAAPGLLGSCEAEAENIARHAVARVTEAHPTIPSVEGKTPNGHPARMLLKEAQDATFLVVGSRGRGGFAGLLLGSVSQQVVHHSPCPVIVVPPDASGC